MASSSVLDGMAKHYHGVSEKAPQSTWRMRFGSPVNNRAHEMQGRRGKSSGTLFTVMAGLVPAIHAFVPRKLHPVEYFCCNVLKQTDVS